MLARTDPGPGGICWNAASRETAKYFKTGGPWQEDPELRTMAVRSTDLTGVQSGCFEKDLSFRLVAGNGAEIHGELKKGRTQYEFALTPDYVCRWGAEARMDSLRTLQRRVPERAYALCAVSKVFW